LATDALKAHIVGPAFSCIENGRVSKGNHFHLFVTPGSCTLGASNGTVPDEQLPQRAGYLGKGPCWNFETALAYLMVKRALPGKRVADRFFHFNLGNQRTRPVTLAIIEEALGYSLAKPNPVEALAVSTQASLPHEQAQALASLPILGEATLQESEQVVRLHRAWSEGRYDGVPLKLQGRSYPDLGGTLETYFVGRTWLRAGEVADLVEIATTFGIIANTAKPTMSKRNQTGHVRPYSSRPHEKPCQTGHVG
jgi:hypothetical protein